MACTLFSLLLLARTFATAGGARLHPTWLSTPVISPIEVLAEILNGGRRVWLAVDEMGWRQHHSPQYRDLAETRMRQVGEFNGVLVFVLEG
jgi:hypothetical protein